MLNIADYYELPVDIEIPTPGGTVLTARPTEQGGYLSDIDTPGEA